MEKGNKKNASKKLIQMLLLLVFLGIFLVSGYKLLDYLIGNRKNDLIMEEMSNFIDVKENTETVIIDVKEENTEPIFIELKENTETVDPKKFKIEFPTLKNKNEDIVGFIKVNNTSVEHIVVKGKDNDYYLKHNLYKEYSIAGWIFADYRNKLDGTDKNIIIYGHNMKNGTMFASLKNVLKKEWYENKENKMIDFITENEEAEYEIFSIYMIPDETYYITTDFKNKAEWTDFIDTLKSRSVKDFGVEITESDSILTLSTCGEDTRYRIVVHAKKISEAQN